MESVKRNSQEFEILRRQWIAKRTFAWLLQKQSLTLHYQQLPEISEGLIYTTIIRLMLQKLATKNSGCS
ncbi:transposase [Dapis sp. BLCC M126]|uniref:transposase n=1 Tax=Dapis sp. BLCC M126 TaxID=3400189 RepID=UPI003CEF4048